MLLNEHFFNFFDGTRPKPTVIVSAFYKFIQLEKTIEIKNLFNDYLKDLEIKGTILLAEEGINSTIAGNYNDMLYFFNKLSELKKFKDIEPKYSVCNINPFLRMKVRLKNEIVTIGDKKVNPNKFVGKYLDPNEWNDFLNDKSAMIIDTRNGYEVSIGSFQNSLNPKLKSFRDFPKWVEKNLVKKNLPKETKIGMFCTGGIRCEKSTSYLKQIGFNNVYQLKGGILKYIEEIPENKSLWNGECFVFDYRVSVDHELNKGSFDMCFACRMPLSEEDKKNKFFLEGKSCHYCYDKTSSKQKKRFEERQRQILLAKKKNLNHIGPKF